LCFDATALADLEAAVRNYLGQHETMDTAAFKAMTGASRKWTIPLGEYLDRIRLTIRVGDERRLREHG
jgi:selenocysteine-specific elongation factor